MSYRLPSITKMHRAESQRRSRSGFAWLRTQMKRLTTGNRKATLTKRERMSAILDEEKSQNTPTMTIATMVAQGNVDPFVAELAGTYDVAKTNTELTARNAQVVSLVGRAEAAEIVPLPFDSMADFIAHVNCQ